MVSRVSRYYQSIISKLGGNPKTEQFHRTSYDLNLTTGFGELIYFSDKKGYFGIIDDINNQYYPINSNQFQHLLKDRCRVHFSLQQFPTVKNIHRWGTTVQVISLRIIV